MPPGRGRPTMAGERGGVAAMRRRLLAAAIAAAWLPGAARAQGSAHPQRRWYERAEAMRQLALGWGDQPYGAVLVLPDGTVADGPSRVMKDRDADAHAERVALREAQRLLGSTSLAGSVLYSTSRPCVRCEQAAARAGVARLYHGPQLIDAGEPRGSL